MAACKDIKAECVERFTKLQTNYENLIPTIDDIRLNVTNHIPTQLKEIREEITKIEIKNYKKPGWLFTLLISLLLFVIGILAGYMTNK